MNPENENLKAVIYCRVSTKEQVTDGMSLTTQENICREYALKNGYEIAQVFIEMGESAKTADRTELKKLLTYCSDKKNRINAVIAYKIDRISRNTDDYSQIRLLLKRYHVEIKSASEYFDNNPAGRFMENIIANVAQFDNDVRTERCVNGMKEAVREGRYVWLAPLGYHNVRINGKATIAPNDDAPKVRKAFELIAKGIYTSVEAVRLDINKSGLLMNNNKPISRSYFYKLLKNKVYIGIIDKFGEQHKGEFDPIIDEELFKYVQRVLDNKGRITTFYKRDSPDFPLRRVVTDIRGQKLTGSWSKGRWGKRYAFYRFRHNGGNFQKARFDEWFVQFANSFAFDQAFYSRFKRYIQEAYAQANAESEKKRLELKERIEQIDELQAGLLLRHENGLISDDVLKRQSQRLHNEANSIQNTIFNTNPEIGNVNEILDFSERFMVNPGDTWAIAELESKLFLQGFYFPAGVVFDGERFASPQTAFIFKVKDELMAALSPMVDHRIGSCIPADVPIPLECVNGVLEDLARLHSLLRADTKL